MRRLAWMLVLATGCFGKTVDDSSPWLGWANEGVTDSGPTYSPLAACTESAPVGGGDDSCLAEPLSCEGAEQYDCWDYESSDALVGGSSGNRATSWLEDGVGHYHVFSARDGITGIGGKRPLGLKFSMRVKVSAATGSVTLARARVPMTDGTDEAADLELTGARLRMCTRAGCVDAGRFGRDVWHTIVFSLDGRTLSARLDCAPDVAMRFDMKGTPSPDVSVSVDYGILWPTCASDVFIDIVRSD